MTSRLRSFKLCAFSVFERQDFESEIFVGRDERRHRLEPEHFGSCMPVAAVRRPKPSIGRLHDDERVEKKTRLLDFLCEALRVRRREVSLEGRRLDRIEGDDGHKQGLSGERLTVSAYRRAAELTYALREARERRVVDTQEHVRADGSPLLFSRRQPFARGASFGLLFLDGLGLLGRFSHSPPRGGFYVARALATMAAMAMTM